MNVALTIAGSDSGGGAGIQADLKTFHQFGVYGTSVITAITAQNTLGVSAWEAVSPALVRAQLDAVVTDLRPAAFKTGMLGTADVIDVVAEAFKRHGLKNYVLDPVMVSTSGRRLLDKGAEDELRRELMPLATLITPNLAEAEVLTGKRPRNQKDMRDAALRILEFGGEAVLVKGGHLEGGTPCDVLVTRGNEVSTWEHARIETMSTHGTGCTLSAAITARLASGVALLEAANAAIGYVQLAIMAAPGLGSGHGPLNHRVEPPGSG